MTNKDRDALEEKVQWLRGGRLDASETLGNLATKIVVDGDEGVWEIPVDGIEVVDDTDLQRMETSPLSVRYEEGALVNVPGIYVFHSASDGESRWARVHVESATYQPKQQ